MQGIYRGTVCGGSLNQFLLVLFLGAEAPPYRQQEGRGKGLISQAGSDPNCEFASS